MIKDTQRKQIVWFRANEEFEILQWLKDEVNVPLSPNMAIRYLCMKALQDKKLRKRATERINLMFEELAKGKPKKAFCCSECHYEDFIKPLSTDGINKHRISCEIYQKLAKERMEKLMAPIKEVVN